MEGLVKLILIFPLEPSNQIYAFDFLNLGIDMIRKGWESVDCQGHLTRISKWKQIQKVCVLVHDDHDILKENIKDQNLKEFFEYLFDNYEHFTRLIMAKCVVP
jgi:hypothetical protein